MKRRPKRFVLGEGYPWAMGLGPEYTEVSMRDTPVGGYNIPLAFPNEWWRRDVPKVRLIAEVIE